MKRKLILFLIFIGFGCTDLNEEILDESSTKGLTNQQAADGLLAPVYGRLLDIFNHTNYFNLQEISTDEAILPYRGGTDWGDNGIYIAMHQHNFSTTDPNLKQTWDFLLAGISRSITAMSQLATTNSASNKIYIAEARGMRAFYSMLTLDLFGIVYVKDTDDVAVLGTVLRGQEAVNYIKSELVAAEPDLADNVGPGRLTKAAAWGLLARLHLNAAVYRNPYGDATFTNEDLDAVVSYCDKIINSGAYQLSTDYFSIFNSDNHTNKELIFAIDQRFDLPGAHNRLAYFSLSGDQFPIPAFPNANGTDGPAITPDYYDTWEAAYAPNDPATQDPRFYKQNLAIYTDPSATCVAEKDFNINRGILRGQQYGLLREKGVFLKCDNGNFKVGKLFNTTRSNPSLPVDFIKQVDYTVAGSNYSSGYRVEKYEFSKKSDSGRNKGDADIIILRLADVYLMRGEAKLRKNNDQGAALDDVNFVRASRTATTPAPALSEMNLDLLFRERGFEFYWEMQRRTDMIRFGKFEGTWTEKSNSDRNKRLFPIPQTAIDGASNNPGYLVQNASY